MWRSSSFKFRQMCTGLLDCLRCGSQPVITVALVILMFWSGHGWTFAEDTDWIYSREFTGMSLSPREPHYTGLSREHRDAYLIFWRNPARSGEETATWGASNPAMGAEIFFSARGIDIVSAEEQSGEIWQFSFGLVSYGRLGAAGVVLPPGLLYPDHNKIESDREVISEFYINSPAGLETVIDLPFKPSILSGGSDIPDGSEGAPVHIDLVLNGETAVWSDSNPTTIRILAGYEEPLFSLTLGDFQDATGRRLSADWEVVEGAEGTVIRILYDDRDAVYPVCGAWNLQNLTLEGITPAPWTAEMREADRAAGGIGEHPDTSWQRLKWLRLAWQSPLDARPDGALRVIDEQRAKLSHTDVSTPRVSRQSVLGNRWYNIGPAPIFESTGKNMSGRVRAVAYDPSDPVRQTYYIGAATGGVWKTTDGGYHWQCLTDSMPSLAIHTLAIDPQNPAIIYAGTGEQLPGAGVYRSRDGGTTWEVLGSSVFDYVAGGEVITKIVLIPTTVQNPLTQRVIVAGGERGVYWSGDAGMTWTTGFGFSLFCDLAVDPRVPTTVYCSRAGMGIYKSTQSGKPGTWSSPLIDANGVLPVDGFGRINLWMHDANPPVLYAAMQNAARGREFKGVWKSSDGGSHWTRVTGLPRQFDEQSFAPPDTFELENNDTIGSATSIGIGQVIQGQIQSQNDVDFYRLDLTGNVLTAEVMAHRAGSTLDPVLQLYDSSGNLFMWKGKPLVSNGGMSPASLDERITMGGWVVLTPGTYYLRVSNAGGSSGLTGQYQLSATGIDVGCQCEYDLAIGVEPGNTSVMYLGLVRLLRSTDGGVNWTDIHNHGGDNWIHPDIHTVAFEPGNPQAMVWGCDGGVFKSADRGDTWININQNLSITQVYPGFSQHPTDPDFMLIGTQDNSGVHLDNGFWNEILGGDAMYMAIIDSQTWFVENEFLLIGKTNNGGVNFTSKTNGLERSGALWSAPYVLDPNNSNVLIAGGGNRTDPQPRYHVYRTTDGADNWAVNSQNLLSQVLSLAIARSDSTTAYAGTVNGRLWRTRDSGATDWTNVTPAGIANRAITDIAVDPTDRDIVYITVSGWTYGLGGHVFRSTDGGVTWNDISSSPWSTTSLPDVQAMAMVIDPNYRNTLFVGTDYGIYRTTDTGVNWEIFELGFPPAAMVTDMVINTTARPEGILRVSTYGRGIWELGHGNDDCIDAQAIVDGTYDGTTRGATADGSTTCTSFGYPDAWYYYTADADGILTIDTCGSGFDTVISLHGPDCPASVSTELACNDQCNDAGCGSNASCLSMTVEAGQSFLIRVSGKNGATGDFVLTVSCTTPNDSCDDAIYLYVPSIALGGTRGTTIDYAPTCDGFTNTSPGVWYTVIGTGNMMTASTCGMGTTYDTMISVYCAGCGGQQCVAANDDTCGTQAEVSWCSAPGRVYHILVHGWNTASGRFQLSLSQSSYCGPIYLNCAPGNDTCDAGSQILFGTTYGDNTGAGTDGFASCASSGADVWYNYTPLCNGFLTIDTCNSGGTLADTVVSVHDSCNGREMACNDDGCGARSRVQLAVTAGDPLHVRVAGYGGAQGTFPLSIDLNIAPLVVAPPGLYFVDGEGTNEDHLMRFDFDNRTVTDVGATGMTDLTGLTWASTTGLMYAIDSSLGGHTLVTLDPGTGIATPFATVAFTAVLSLAYDSNTNRLFGIDTNLDQLVEFNPYSGAARTIGLIGFNAVAGLAFDPLTNTLYGSDLTTDQLLVIDTGTGTGTAIGPFGGQFDTIGGLAFDTLTRTLYGVQKDIATSQVRIVTIDTVTGIATQIARPLDDLGGDGLEVIPGLPGATVGIPYGAEIPAAGGCPGYYFSSFSNLPPEIHADSQGGLSGTPTTSGTYIIGFIVDDSDLSTPSVTTTIPLHVHPANDYCHLATSVGDGTYWFSTLYAVTDGPDEPAACNASGDSQVGSDIWFCYTASCSGTLIASLCGSGYDTRLAVYDDCTCPPTSPPLACNDDYCGLQSEVSVSVTAGQRYGVRVGGFNEARGTGFLSLSCSGEASGGCCVGGGCSRKTLADCQALGGWYQGDGSTCVPDTDNDGLPDTCDGCPDDPRKTDPGICGCHISEQDADGDGTPDCIDTDSDGDGVENTEDSAPGDRFLCRDVDQDGCDDCSDGYDDPTNDGIDADLDGYCDTGDCSFANPTVWKIPGESNGLSFVSSSVLTWSMPTDPGCLPGTLLFDTLVSLNPANLQTSICIESDGGDTSTTIAETPPPGTVYYYLVRAVNPCGDGSTGEDSTGIERLSPPCP